MNKKIELLQKEIVIPDIVQQKADQAFAQIQAEASKETAKKRPRRMFHRHIWIAAAAATFLIGTVTVAAAYIHHSRSLSGGLQISAEQQQMLSENNLSKDILQSVSDSGVTITALQTITDSHYAYLTFQVEGYDCPADQQPDFEFSDVTISGVSLEDSMLSYSAGFYDGLTTNNNGDPVYDDGSPYDVDENGSIIMHYQDENGNYEYQIALYSSDEDFSMIGQKLHVSLRNLGTVDKSEYFPELTGTWEFDFTLAGSDAIRFCTPDASLGDSGAVVSSVSFSPISMEIVYDFPRQIMTGTRPTGDGSVHEVRSTVRPPYLYGVRLKDGSILGSLNNGPGLEGYIGDDESHYVSRFATSRVIEPDQVEALLFIPTDADISMGYEGVEMYEVTLEK